jgi:GMP synthase-like glutamine amidotransferase
LQHADQEHAGLIGQTLAEFKVKVEVVRPDLGWPLPQSADQYNGLVMMGGPQAVYDEVRSPFLVAEKRLVRSAIQLGVPILGVCLGCQILAECLGGSVQSGRPEIGWFEVLKATSANSDPLFREFPTSFSPLHWHGDVLELPPGCVAFGSSARTVTQGFSFMNQCYGLLFHLEMTPEMVEAMCDAFPEELARAGASAADIVGVSASRIRELEPIARTFLGRWAGLVLSRCEVG